jgi:hypothetical protein
MDDGKRSRDLGMDWHGGNVAEDIRWKIKKWVNFTRDKNLFVK